MIRVTLISPCMGGYGGLEAFVLAIAGGVHQEGAFKVQILFKRTNGFQLSQHLEDSIRKSKLDIQFVDKASNEIWKSVRNADVVHVQNPCPDVVLMARLARKPLLINVINHSHGGKSLHQRLWTRCLRLGHKRFYISNFVRRSWEHSEVPWRGSTVQFPICDLSPLTPLPIEQRKGFVFVARWIENKGLDTLVEAYARAKLDPQLWPLRLLGDGPLRPRIEARITDLDLQGVEMPGFTTQMEKAENIRRSRFAVIPPNTGEDFGLVAIEARHLGVPCMITRDGGVPEAAGEHCLACDPGDVEALGRLLRQAATMPEKEYRQLAIAAHDSLEAELVRPSFYGEVYRSMAV